MTRDSGGGSDHEEVQEKADRVNEIRQRRRDGPTTEPTLDWDETPLEH